MKNLGSWCIELICQQFGWQPIRDQPTSKLPSAAADPSSLQRLVAVRKARTMTQMQENATMTNDFSMDFSRFAHPKRRLAPS